MERHLKRGGLTFYLTWSVHQLPTYGKDVVAIVLGDEWARRPRYTSKVGAVFKCYGTQSKLGCHPLSNPTYLNVLTTLQFLLTSTVRIPGALRGIWDRMRSPGHDSEVFAIPLGYANQTALPIKPVRNRRYDASFAGSIQHKPRSIWSPKRWLQTPKSLSRQSMSIALARVQDLRPEWLISLSQTAGYHAIRSADPSSYSELMMDTKVALVPRGTSLETFRYFESMRAGCVVIAEALPDRWFYDGSPAIQIEDWSTLDEILGEIFSNPDRLQYLHEASLDWWQRVCSEEAVGRFMSDRLNARLRS